MSYREHMRARHVHRAVDNRTTNSLSYKRFDAHNVLTEHCACGAWRRTTVVYLNQHRSDIKERYTTPWREPDRYGKGGAK